MEHAQRAASERGSVEQQKTEREVAQFCALALIAQVVDGPDEGVAHAAWRLNDDPQLRGRCRGRGHRLHDTRARADDSAMERGMAAVSAVVSQRRKPGATRPSTRSARILSRMFSSVLSHVTCRTVLTGPARGVETRRSHGDVAVLEQDPLAALCSEPISSVCSSAQA